MRVVPVLGTQYACIKGAVRRYLPQARIARLVSGSILPSNPAA